MKNSLQNNMKFNYFNILKEKKELNCSCESISASNSKIFDASFLDQNTFDNQYDYKIKDSEHNLSPRLIDFEFSKPKVVGSHKTTHLNYPYRRWKKKTKISMALENYTCDKSCEVIREDNNKSVLLPIGSKENMLNFKIKQESLSPQRHSFLQLLEKEKNYGCYYDERIARKNYLARQLSKKL